MIAGLLSFTGLLTNIIVYQTKDSSILSNINLVICISEFIYYPFWEIQIDVRLDTLALLSYIYKINFVSSFNLFVHSIFVSYCRYKRYNINTAPSVVARTLSK